MYLINLVLGKPPAAMWYREILKALSHERLGAALKTNGRFFTELWALLLGYLLRELSHLVLRSKGLDAEKTSDRIGSQMSWRGLD